PPRTEWCGVYLTLPTRPPTIAASESRTSLHRREMIMANRQVRFHFLWLAGVLLAALTGESRAAEPKPALHAECSPLPTDLLGPFARQGDGSMLAIDGDASRFSTDEGKTWSAPRPLFTAGQNMKISPERALLRTRDGALILAFMNYNDIVFNWDKVRKDAPAARLPTYA